MCVQFLLVRPTAFEKAGSSGKNAPVEALTLATPVEKSASSKFVAANVTKSERPELTAARGTEYVPLLLFLGTFYDFVGSA